MKILDKAIIISKGSVTSIMNEQKFLKQIKNDFLVNMKWSFQDEKYLYVVMEYLNGNDLRHYIKQRKEAVKYLEAEMDKQKEILASY